MPWVKERRAQHPAGGDAARCAKVWSTPSPGPRSPPAPSTPSPTTGGRRSTRPGGTRSARPFSEGGVWSSIATAWPFGARLPGLAFGPGYRHQFSVRVGAVHRALHGGPYQGDHLALVRGGAVREAHAHAAEADRRNVQSVFSKHCFLHGVLQHHAGRLGGHTNMLSAKTRPW